MLERIMNAISEEGLAQLMNSLEEKKLDRLMDCIEEECEDEAFIEIMPAVLKNIKGINGGKAGCSLIKTFIKDGPLHDLVQELLEEIMIKVINALSEKDMQTLINMGKEGKARTIDVVILAKKLLPIIQNAKCGKGVTHLIDVFKKVEQMYNSMIGRRNNRWSSNQGGVNAARGMRNSGSRRRGSNNQEAVNSPAGGGMMSMNGAGGGPMPGNNGPAGGPNPGTNGAGGGPMPAVNSPAGGGMAGTNGAGGGPMTGMNGAGEGSMPGKQS
ncbi:uncharacterized protein M6D78_013258 [Vipera latastei]